MQDYKEFKIYARPLNIDLISGALWELEILGLNEYEDYLSIFVYEESKVSEMDITEKLDLLKSESLIDSFSIATDKLVNKNWNEEWEKKINVIEVSDRIVIKPTFREYEAKENQIVITIDPKMSFGTGEHQTTKLVLKILEKHLKPGHRVLDVGSGTSVLGIAAKKLGAKRVVAIDNDEWCFINGKENVERNQISNMEVLLGTIDDVFETEFDLVMANINSNVLQEIKQKLFEKVKSSGVLILSGLLISDLEEINKAVYPIRINCLRISTIR